MMEELSSMENKASVLSNRTVLWVLRLILAGVFIYAGVLKFLDPASFSGSIATFQLIPEAWSNLVALSLPPFEVLIGILILTPFGVRSASFGVILLNLIFLVALFQGLIRGLPVDCGCFGSSGPSTPATVWLAIGRDLVFVAMAFAIWRKQSK